MLSLSCPLLTLYQFRDGLIELRCFSKHLMLLKEVSNFFEKGSVLEAEASSFARAVLRLDQSLFSVFKGKDGAETPDVGGKVVEDVRLGERIFSGF